MWRFDVVLQVDTVPKSALEPFNASISERILNRLVKGSNIYSAAANGQSLLPQMLQMVWSRMMPVAEEGYTLGGGTT